MLVVMICCAFLAPLAVIGVWSFLDEKEPIITFWQKAFRHSWLKNQTLVGVETRPTAVPLSWHNLANGSWQKSFAATFDRNFPGREALIRGISEVYAAVFHETAVDSGNLAFGKGKVVFEKGYFTAEFLSRPSEATTREWVAKLAELQRRCRERRLPLVFVLTPSKVPMHPEWVPEAWKAREKASPNPYHLLVRLLNEAGVEFVDGPAITKATIEQSVLKTPAFPPGGIHWTLEATVPTVNEILRRLRAQGLDVDPLKISNARLSQTPSPQDVDILQMMNLARNWTYPTVELEIERRSKGARHSMAVVGGSFGGNICQLLQLSNQFSEIDMFFYLKIHKQTWIDGVMHIAREPAETLDYGREIFSADCLLLELNQGAMNGAFHLVAFLNRALAYLDENVIGTGRGFSFESYLDCQPGRMVPTTREFSSEAKPLAFTGFGPPEAVGIWSFENHGIFRLRWGGRNGQPLKLKLVSGVDLKEAGCRKAIVTVSVNGAPLCEWTYDTEENIGPREAVIPANQLQFGREMTVSLVARQVEPTLREGATESGLRILVSAAELSDSGSSDSPER